MSRLWVLLLLTFTAALPVILAYIWFRTRRFSLSPAWFLISLAAGMAALPPAVLIQYFVHPGRGFSDNTAPAGVFLGIFFRIALTEELSRFLVLFLVFRLRNLAESRKGAGPVQSPSVFGAVSGLLAGLGFALVENAYYGAANVGITLIRAFTAAPLHGACGARVGTALVLLRRSPGHALLKFLSAAALHGMYNFMIVSPGIPAFFPVLIALTALAASIQGIHHGQGARQNEK